MWPYKLFYSLFSTATLVQIPEFPPLPVKHPQLPQYFSRDTISGFLTSLWAFSEYTPVGSCFKCGFAPSQGGTMTFPLWSESLYHIVCRKDHEFIWSFFYIRYLGFYYICPIINGATLRLLFPHVFLILSTVSKICFPEIIPCQYFLIEDM